MYILIFLWMCLLFQSFINIFVLILTIQFNLLFPRTKAFTVAVETHAGTHLIFLSKKKSIILDKSVTVIFWVNIDDAVWKVIDFSLINFWTLAVVFRLDALKVKLSSCLILLISILLIWWSLVCHNSFTHQDISYFC